MEIEKLKEYVRNWFGFYKSYSYPTNVHEHNEAYNLIIGKIETEKIKIVDIDCFVDLWVEQKGFAGEDNFFYAGAKEMLKYLIEKEFLQGPDEELNGKDMEE